MSNKWQYQPLTVLYVLLYTYMCITCTLPQEYSPDGIVEWSPSIIAFNIGITVSFSNQISDHIKISIPELKEKRECESDQ